MFKKYVKDEYAPDAFSFRKRIHCSLQIGKRPKDVIPKYSKMKKMLPNLFWIPPVLFWELKKIVPTLIATRKARKKFTKRAYLFL